MILITWMDWDIQVQNVCYLVDEVGIESCAIPCRFVWAFSPGRWYCYRSVSINHCSYVIIQLHDWIMNVWVQIKIDVPTTIHLIIVQLTERMVYWLRLSSQVVDENRSWLECTLPACIIYPPHACKSCPLLELNRKKLTVYIIIYIVH